MIGKSLILICAIGLCAAGKTCPDEASGVYPLCTCKEFDFIFKDDECVKVNRDVCPEPAIQTPHGCRCPDSKDFFDDYYWLCRTKLYLPTANPTTPIARSVCAVYERGTWPNCEKIPCGKHQSGDYEPYCTLIIDPSITVHEKKCPVGEVGTPPFCSAPCPRYKARLIKYNNGTTVHPDTIRFNSSIAYNVTCEPIPCSKLRGWSGEFMPNCTYKPFCPDGFPGNYPYCNKYAITTTTLPTVATAPTKTTTPATKTTKSKVLSRLGNKEILNNSIDDNPHNVANNYRI